MAPLICVVGLVLLLDHKMVESRTLEHEDAPELAHAPGLKQWQGNEFLDVKISHGHDQAGLETSVNVKERLTMTMKMTIGTTQCQNYISELHSSVLGQKLSSVGN